MNATGGLLGRWLITICGMVPLFTGTGCSYLIASAGRANMPVFAPGSTSQAVRATWGEPDTSEIRDDGSRVEIYRHNLRKEVKSLWQTSSPDPKIMRDFREIEDETKGPPA